MKINEKIKGIFEILKINLNNEAIINDVSYSAFILSLLPIPVIQQSAQIIDRIASNKKLSICFNEVWDEVKSINSKLVVISDEMKKFQEIAGTIKFNEKLNAKFSALINDTIALLNQSDSEWTVLTENWSYQKILNSLVDVDYAKIIATSGSTNVIENTKIKAKTTLLHSSNQSKNFVNNTSFNGVAGSVEMNGISTQGNITVSGSGIGFGAGSSIVFGSNPNILKGECPICKTLLQFDKRQLIGYSNIKCFNCNTIMPFNF